MLKTNELIEKIGEEYTPMLRKVDIPDFYKCIAQFSGLRINEVSDDAIYEYLKKWCKNKKRFFDLMNGNTRVDLPFEYVQEEEGLDKKFTEIALQYPLYYHWINKFAEQKKNKIEKSEMGYIWRIESRDLFPGVNFEGMSITSFFKRYLSAPDELVTAIGRIFENQKIKANFTISIDPIDIMLASENPYHWTSCYRLETDFENSHADGNLAAILDTSSFITYVWNNEGKFSLYDNYDFKSIRYKRMRMFVAASKNFNSLHFNEVYPGKDMYSKEFKKSLRNVVENYICNQLGIESKWKYNSEGYRRVEREYAYGYDEFDDDYIYYQIDSEAEDIYVYDEKIICPCGCGDYLPGTENYDYNGEGHIYENYDVDD